MSEEHSPALPEENAPRAPQEATPEDTLPAEIVEKLPAHLQRVIQHSISATVMGNFPNPIADKLTAEHISAMIAADEREGVRALEDQKHARNWQSIIAVLIIIAVALLLGYFAFLQQNSLVAEIIKMAAVGLGGFGGGYGFARWRGRG